jgi:hypothetical protein
LAIAISLASAAHAAPPAPSPFAKTTCAGQYRYHLQGVCTNERDALYWCFTDALVKTNVNGAVTKKIAVGNHHGDLCHHDGRLYVAVNFGRFNDDEKRADSWVYVYDADDLKLLSKHKTPELVYGAGGLANIGNRFFVVGGLPDGFKENYVYEYDAKFRFVKKHIIASGYTRLGIQTATYADGRFWFGCYGNKLLKTDAKFKLLGKYDFDCGIGIVITGADRFLVARGSCDKEKGCNGRLLQAQPDEKLGLKLQP